jgi:adenosylcobinamide-GDP ribazoletransferase
MNGFLTAIQFLTILPIGYKGSFNPQKMQAFFPLVGLLIGAMLVGIDWAASLLWPVWVVALIDVTFLAWVTGALHLDGLADTADGLYGKWSKEKTLSIMKDSRTGAMGVVAIVLCLLLKAGALAALHEQRYLYLLIIPCLARSSFLFGFRFLPYGRSEEGTGRPFFDQKPGVLGFWGLLIPLGLTIVMGWNGLTIGVAFLIITLIILIYYKQRLGSITGDMFGAMAESEETLLFLIASVTIGGGV